LLGFGLPAGTDSILVMGSLFIVFLAGLETRFDFLRHNLRRALIVGVPGFLVPFVGLFLLLSGPLHAPLLVSIIGATVLADTSISIVYTTLQQYELADLPFGRLILAITLCVNLAEDLTITSTTFLTTPGVLFTLVVLGALAGSAILLPRLQRALRDPPGTLSFSNLPARTLLFSLALLALLSTLVGVPGILFVFLMGLLFSRWASEGFLRDVRQLAFAVFVPLYFLAVGLRVDPTFVVDHWPLLVVLLAVGTALKIGAVYPIARRVLGPERAAPVSVLFNTRLTSATVILTLTVGLGILPVGWYSVFVATVVLLALGSAAALRGFSAFQSVDAARALFWSPKPARPGCRAPRWPTTEPVRATSRSRCLGVHPRPARPGTAHLEPSQPDPAGGRAASLRIAGFSSEPMPSAPSVAASPQGVDASVDERKIEDATVVARRVFQDFELREEDLTESARILAMFSGGLNLERLLDAARKKPGQPWATVPLDRRQACISSAMTFHCSAADMERMALRTGAGLLLLGNETLARKILETAPDSSFGVEDMGVRGWGTIVQLCLYTAMLSIMVVQSVLSGLLLFIVPAAVVFLVAVPVVWLLERDKWRLKREEGEAQRYLRALQRLGQGATPMDVFAPDGSLRSATG
ncbi:MAG: cation:proton antiporter, partial [Thermoplasmata archaeon]|nr:cation:proton antiporter [Thermoplasmata archaeon]